MKKTDNQMLNLLNTVKQQMHEENPLEDINLFSILKMENKEVSAHSAFLYYIFKPFTVNGKRDDKNLRILFHSIMHNEKPPEYIDINREVATEFGRLDFLINYETDGKQNAIVIELKIWASEQYNQIERYCKYMTANSWNPKNIFFLTPDMRNSQTGNSENITLKNEIKSVLEQIIETRKSYSNYQIIINHYLQIINKLTGEAFMDKLNIIKSGNDIKAVDELYNIKIKVLTELLKKFMETLQNELTINGHFATEIGAKLNAIWKSSDSFDKTDVDLYFKRGSKTLPAIAFYIDKKYLKPEIKKLIGEEINIYYFIEVNWYLYSGFTIRTTDENDKIIAINISDELKAVLNNISKVDDRPTPFINWDYIKCDNQKIHFNGYSEHDGFLRLLENESLEFDRAKINNIVENIKQLFDESCKHYFDINN